MTLPRPVIVIGAGGHARVVADALLCAGTEVLGFTDADPTTWGRSHFGLPILGGDGSLANHNPSTLCLVNGLGSINPKSSMTRRRVQETMMSNGWVFVGVRHPSATISPQAQLADDAQILAGATVQPGASIATGAIVNTRAVVEHDVQIGAWSHVAPGAVVCGDIRIGTHTHVGAGATVRQGLRLGNHCLIGLGAVVISDLPDSTTVIGVPARSIELKK